MTEIAQNRRRVFGDVVRVFIHRYMKRLARRHVAAHEPQVAVFAFDIMGTAISLFGRFEREELDVLGLWLDQRGCVGGACVDAGANIGNHALFFARRFSKVCAFEPNQKMFKLLKINSAEATNIICFNVGLSDRRGEAHFVVPTAINTGVGFIPSDNRESAGSVRIDVVPLDEVQEVASEKLKLFKIDVEGHELPVLKGAQKLISRDRPIVIFEQGQKEFSNNTSPSIEFLKDLGYHRFLTIEKSPQLGNSYLNVAARLLCGERVAIKDISSFDRKTYSMIIAVTD